MPRQTKKRSKVLSDKMESNILDPVSTIENKQHVDTNESEKNLAKNDKENLLKIIALLEDKVQTIVAENLQYGKRIKNEEQKWQEALNMKTRQIKMFKIKIQKLRKLQIQEKKKMERNIKTLNAVIEKLKKNSNKDLIRVVSEISTADLTARFKEVYEPLKQSGYKFDVKDANQFIKNYSIVRRLLDKSCSDSPISSTSSMDKMDYIESEEDMDKESEEDTDKESEEDTDKESEEDTDKESEEDTDKESEEDTDKESEADTDKESMEDVAKESEKDMDKESKEEKKEILEKE
ncbi:myb-like protein X [Nylanderia fulva]|uniref:myb-like protein X n=1 Tax=Nylanderia fulva TaxID=613905 RepID=UPI0010FB89E2|nr:myb-like protein X [Nylanderia fulva]